LEPVGNGGKDTESGGAEKDFPVTQWSLVLGLQAATPEQRRRALEALCARYWKPVYVFLRRSFGLPSESAKDLTQGFFEKILEQDSFEAYRRERGGFRTYLKTLLRGFAADANDRDHALKRGGGRRIGSLDSDEGYLEALLAERRELSPEEALDLVLLAELLQGAIQRAQQAYEGSGRAAMFRCFALRQDGLSYADVAARTKLSTSVVRNHIHAVRETIREEARRDLAQSTPDAEALDEEWRQLLGDDRLFGKREDGDSEEV
jgi:RNA polymerase sigma factor (sigma-70 family)